LVGPFDGRRHEVTTEMPKRKNRLIRLVGHLHRSNSQEASLLFMLAMWHAAQKACSLGLAGQHADLFTLLSYRYSAELRLPSQVLGHTTQHRPGHGSLLGRSRSHLLSIQMQYSRFIKACARHASHVDWLFLRPLVFCCFELFAQALLSSPS
jgi:hypothetical protein